MLAFLVLAFSDDKEVNDAGGEIQRFMSFAMDDRNAVAISIAGPRHATTKDEKWGPGRGEKIIINHIKLYQKQQA